MSEIGADQDRSNAAVARPDAEAPQPSSWGLLGDLWPLLVGIFLLMVGNGLQASLLGVRAHGEAFGPTATGVMMAAFFAGFVVGSSLADNAISKVGHTRVFAALSAVASISILVHALQVDVATWTAMRFVTGICFAGVFVAAESWLNVRAGNTGRGAALGLYMVASYAGMAGGQGLLPLADPTGETLFMLVSAVISAAAVPLLLSASPAPAPSAARTSLARLYAVSPLGFVGVAVSGLVNGAVFGMGVVYAVERGFDVTETAAFMTAVILGGAALQWPIGKLSDQFDRRRVIFGVALAAGGVALLLWLRPPAAGLGPLAVVGLYGGLALSLHALTLAYVNDYLEPTEMVGAGAALVLVLGLGSVTGPLLAGQVLGVFGAGSYFALLAMVHGGLAGFALWRMTIRPPIPMEEQGPYVAAAVSPSPVAIDAGESAHAEGVSQAGEPEAPRDADESAEAGSDPKAR